MGNRMLRGLIGRAGLVGVAALALAVPTMAQTSDDHYTIVEISPFAGYQWFHAHPVHRTLDGLIGGVRLTEDFSRFWALEESYTVGLNDVRLRLFGTNQALKFESRNFTIAINPVLHLRPRDRHLRPFLTWDPVTRATPRMKRVYL